MSANSTAWFWIAIIIGVFLFIVLITYYCTDRITKTRRVYRTMGRAPLKHSRSYPEELKNLQMYETADEECGEFSHVSQEAAGVATAAAAIVAVAVAASGVKSGSVE